MRSDVILCTTVLFLVQIGGGLAGVPRAGTIGLVLALALASWRLWAQGSGWAELGLRAPTHWWLIPLGVVTIYAAIGVGNAVIIVPLAKALSWPPQDITRLDLKPGDVTALVGLLLLAWTTAGFGEEMLFRGFLQSRIEGALGGGAWATASAIVLQALLFGVGHGYLGIRGAAIAAMVGAICGVAYIAFGRNLWPLIAAHAVIDTVSLTVIFLGARPA